MRYPPNLLDDIRSRLPVSQVVASKVALKKAGREYRGLSPFKVEKTPSFFVNDQKAFYHCFASGEHGDIFTFLMKTEGLSFPEAVERLAEEAGVALPKPNEADQTQQATRDRLYTLLADTSAFFRAALRQPEHDEARAYLERRGLLRTTIETFDIGYAPNKRDALKAHLSGRGYTLSEMILAGVVIGGDDIAVPYDRFRHRIMFPIADAKARVIAFGGRALDPNQLAKYHNSPETPLFHKGANLYNFHRARPVAFERDEIIVVEGYMDAVALSEAGISQCVAPLGTALTEAQIRLLWRIVPEPILCFDGDEAGRKAAYRAIDNILPRLEPGKSARFAFLPDGMDPDDVIRQQGTAAFQAIIARASPMAQVLFDREWEQGTWDTPERRADLEARLGRLTAAIGDPTVRQHYARALRDRMFQSWSKTRRASAKQSAPRWSAGGKPPRVADRTQRPGGEPPPTPSTELKRSHLVAGKAARPPYREALLVATLINHPWLLAEAIEDVAALALTSQAMSRLKDALLTAAIDHNSLDTASLRNQLSESGLGGLLDLLERALTHRSDRFLDPKADPIEVEAGWRHTLALHQQLFGLQQELKVAEQAFHEDGSSEALTRICEIKALLAEPETMEFPADP